MLREDIKGLQKVTPRDLRKFGLVVGGVFLGLGVLFYLRHKPWWPWLLGPGAFLFVLGTILPRSLKWIYLGWMTLAMMLGAIVSTVLLSLIFFLMVTPLGWIARLAGRDFLRRQPAREARSHWILRDVTAPKSRQSHERQF